MLLLPPAAVSDTTDTRHRMPPRRSPLHPPANTASAVPDDSPPSKSQRKRDMDALQDIGAALVALNDAQLAAVDLPENLRDAVLECRRMNKFEARRRQLQYIGKLMRLVDAAPISEKLEGWRSSSAAQTAQLHRIERWRDRLLAEPAAVALFISEFPGTDTQRLRTLIRNAADDKARGKPPRSYRALFQMIREQVDSQTPGSDDAVQAPV